LVLVFQQTLISERLKYQEYSKTYEANYFRRTHTRQEIDWAEDRNEQLSGYEFKWKTGKKIKAPTLLSKAYPKAEFKIITPDDYLDWIS